MSVHYTAKHKIPFEVDDEDDEVVSRYTWYISCGYVTTKTWDVYKGVKIGYITTYLHILLMGKAPKGLVWDHFDRNKLNNHKDNFRLTTFLNNTRNRNLNSNSITGHTGVGYNPITMTYFSYINFRISRVILGPFITIEEAVVARKQLELEHWGQIYTK